MRYRFHIYLLRSATAVLLVLGVVIVLVVGAIVFQVAVPAWTGLGATVAEASRAAQAPITLWDVLELVVVPLVLLAGAGLLVSFWYLDVLVPARQRLARDELFEEQRRAEARTVAVENSQAAALQAYLELMTRALLHDGLAEPGVPSALWTVVVARTHAVLRSVNGRHKSTVVEFLYRANLLGTPLPTVQPAAAALLSSADLSGVDFRRDGLVSDDMLGASSWRVDLSAAVLTGANLLRANLTLTDLSGATLAGATLLEARLDHSILRGAVLDGAVLKDATVHATDLSAASLRGANIVSAECVNSCLEHVTLTAAQMDDVYFEKVSLRGANAAGVSLHDAGFEDCDLRGVDLSASDLSLAEFRFCDLTDARLTGANLTETVLVGSILVRADLRDCTGLTRAQLQAAGSLAGARLPDVFADLLRAAENVTDHEPS